MCTFCIQSDDVLCGTLHCDISAISNLQFVNFGTRWTSYTNWTFTSGRLCSTIATYKTFYSGPDRPDPGLVPDGAACGTDQDLQVGLTNNIQMRVIKRFQNRLVRVSSSSSS